MNKLEVIEHDCLNQGAGLEDQESRVSAFVDIILEFDDAVAIVLLSKFLRNRKAFGNFQDRRYLVCSTIREKRTDLIKACTSHGHISVLFVHDQMGEMVRRFQSFGFYSPGHSVRFGAGDSCDPIDREGWQSLEQFLESTDINNHEMVSFSHDADQYYEIRARGCSNS